MLGSDKTMTAGQTCIYAERPDLEMRERKSSMINMLFNGVPANIMALAGLVFAFIMTCLLLVKCNDRLPKDQGREFAVNGAFVCGKPRGAGFIFILVFIVSVVLFCERLNTEIITSLYYWQLP